MSNPDGLHKIEEDEDVEAAIAAAADEIRKSIERAAAAGVKPRAIVYALLYRDPGSDVTKTDLIGAGDVGDAIEELDAALAGEYEEEA